MSKVLIAEGLGYNLLSVSQLMVKGIHLEADSTTQEFKLYHGRGGLYIGKAVLKNNVFVLDFVPDLGTADSDGIVTFTSWTHPPDLDPDFSPEGSETTSAAAETTSAAAGTPTTLTPPVASSSTASPHIDDIPPTPAQQLTPTPREVHRSAKLHYRLLLQLGSVSTLTRTSHQRRHLARTTGTPKQHSVKQYNPSRRTRQRLTASNGRNAPTYAPLEKVYSDILYNREPGQGAYSYTITFIDAATRYVWHLNLPSKDMAFEAFIAWLPVVERESGEKLKSFQSDGGGEYTSQRFKQFLAEKGIKRLVSLPYAHQQQGVAERLNRTLQNTMRKLLRGMRLPNHQWPEAMDHAVMLHNLLSSSSLPNNASPHLLWTGKQGNTKMLRVFGCMVQYRPPSARAGRFSQRAQWGLHLGIEKNYNAWKIFDVHSKETVAARDVIFYERLTLPTYLANLEENRDPTGGFRGDRHFASATDEADWDEQNNLRYNLLSAEAKPPVVPLSRPPRRPAPALPLPDVHLHRDPWDTIDWGNEPSTPRPTVYRPDPEPREPTFFPRTIPNTNIPLFKILDMKFLVLMLPMKNEKEEEAALAEPAPVPYEDLGAARAHYMRTSRFRANDDLWHQRLDHLSHITLKNCIEAGVFAPGALLRPDGTEVRSTSQPRNCTVCPEAVLSHQPFPLLEPGTNRYTKLEKVYSDFLVVGYCGIDDEQYTLTFIDTGTRYVWVVNLEARSRAYEAFCLWLAHAQR
ncbi:unnamed protein product [Closterium sp. NIES-53]